ncbi:relaxase/mobilization nuclease RlxS [Shumkonia mesophila]|uniref:relaxase/mobilization nuclease RlxS n=1 Tax=Shumkonia mesophila TaxID=2838854 RepID=UPI00293497D6|nr:relaxase/mobilization nuclease RlxS [Shumkonia mesophila]
MAQDDDFTPKLGRIRLRGSKRGRRYLHQVLRAVALAGSRSSARQGRFHGNRIGRGSGVGRVLASRDRYAAFRVRRVVVKSRIVKLKGLGLKAARLHLRYVQRDGVTREGLPGELYDAVSDRADGKAFLDRGKDDRHQFRFVVAAEDGAEYDDLKGFTRRLMSRMEEDLGTQLDWVAVDHYNTGHPHTHVVLRGRDDEGRDLVIARDYLATGMRERAAEIVTFDLEPRTDIEIEDRLRLEVEQERLTSLDRRLLREVDDDGFVRSGTAADDAFHQILRAGRLQKLKRLGLAEEGAPGRWRLADDLESVLRRMGERGDIIKAMHREMTRQGEGQPASDYAIYDPADPAARRLVGRVGARGLSDEINDRHYLIVDGVDGRVHYVDIGKADTAEPLAEGAIVAIEPNHAEPKAVDRTVAQIAAANGGRYSVDIHLRHDPSATAAFAETHVRRLEAMRRRGVGIERQSDGAWIIAPDHLDHAAAYERGRVQASSVTVETLSALPLGRQVEADGATWLDRELLADAPIAVRDAGFGRELRRALDRRRQWLIEQDLAHQEQDRIVYRANLLGLLRRRELARVAGLLSDELGLQYTEAKAGDWIEGVYRRRIDLASGRFAVIERSREFTLVPWRPVLARNLDKPVSGIVRGDTISWSLGRKRSGPGIS